MVSPRWYVVGVYVSPRWYVVGVYVPPRLYVVGVYVSSVCATVYVVGIYVSPRLLYRVRGDTAIEYEVFVREYSCIEYEGILL
jgi:hypothetical protein